MAKRNKKPQKHKKQTGRSPVVVETGRAAAERPTEERKAHGVWAEPQGTMKASQPVVDLACDVIGWLYEGKKINSAQEQAARMFESARVRYLQEIPDIAGYKSCLAGGIPGYDDGDGDPVVIAAYREMEAKLSRLERVNLVKVCDNEEPPSLEYLRSGLNVLSGVVTTRKMVYL